MIPPLILLIVFLLLLALNVPVSFSMILACILALLSMDGAPIGMVGVKLYAGIDTFPFLAIPLFILAGSLMEHGGISERLVRLARSLVGHIRGGLGFVVIVSEVFFSGISGSSIADASAIGSLLLPSMVKAGYRPAQATAIVAAATGMGMMIPPCLNMVVLGAVSNLSLAGLFVGGLLPGLLMAVSLMAVIYIQARRGTLPSTREARPSWRELLRAVGDSVIPLMMPVIIFGGIRAGIFTATEGAAVATVYAFVVSVFVYRQMTLRDVYRVLTNTAALTGVVCLLVGAATLFSWILAAQGVPDLIGRTIGAAPGGQWTFLALSIVLFLAFGMVLDGLPAILIFFPIMLPLAQAMQVDPLHYGVLVIAVIGIAIVAPPVGLCLVILSSLSGTKVTETTRPLMPYMAVLVLDLAIIACWPWLVLALPHAFHL
jgi:C4-dicarboxylate transporter DctM subunit